MPRSKILLLCSAVFYAASTDGLRPGRRCASMARLRLAWKWAKPGSKRSSRQADYLFRRSNQTPFNLVLEARPQHACPRTAKARPANLSIHNWRLEG